MFTSIRTAARPSSIAKAIAAIALVVTALSAGAQPATKAYRIGVLLGGPQTSVPFHGFRLALRDLGWIEGHNVTIVGRYADGDADRLPALAAELVALEVDVILAGPTPPAIAARNATSTIPIVMLGAAQPVELGLVTDLRHPGGNVTGISWSVNLEIIAKGIELLKQALPKLRHVAVVWNSTNPAQFIAVDAVKSAARSLGVELTAFDVRRADGLDAAFAAMAKKRVDGVLVVADALFSSHTARIADLERRYRIPSMHGLPVHVDAGGLLFYGPDQLAIGRRGAAFVDQILKGAKPADLPVEQPTKYDLVINMKTARSLGITIPNALRVRAERLIE